MCLHLIAIHLSFILFFYYLFFLAFIVHPASINTTNGTQVEFTCVANENPSLLGFVVNGSIVDPSKGFDEQPTELLGDDTYSRTLLAIASVADNDDSTIRCRAIKGSEVIMSNRAILRVQGSHVYILCMDEMHVVSTINVFTSLTCRSIIISC